MKNLNDLLGQEIRLELTPYISPESRLFSGNYILCEIIPIGFCAVKRLGRAKVRHILPVSHIKSITFKGLKYTLN